MPQINEIICYYVQFQASAAAQMRNSLFWDVKQSKKTACPLMKGPIGQPETSVTS